MNWVSFEKIKPNQHWTEYDLTDMIPVDGVAGREGNVGNIVDSDEREVDCVATDEVVIVVVTVVSVLKVIVPVVSVSVISVSVEPVPVSSVVIVAVVSVSPV